MINLLQFVPISIRDQIVDMIVDYEGMRLGSSENNAWIQFPCYKCFIEDNHGIQGEGIAAINEKTTPEEAQLIAIEQAVNNLLAWREFNKQQEVE